jgi:hypothetical protein
LPVENNHQDIFIGIGVAAVFVLMVVCGIAVTIQNPKPD